MNSNRNRPKPASWARSTSPGEPKNYVVVYDTDYERAGFCFQQKAEVTRPVASFELDGAAEKTLTSELEKIHKHFPIEVVIVPPTLDGSSNLLLELVPIAYNKQTAKSRPTFSQCLTGRAIALQQGQLIEEGYLETERVLEMLGLVSDKNPPSAWLYSYVFGCEVVARSRPMKASDFWWPGKER